MERERESMRRYDGGGDGGTLRFIFHSVSQSWESLVLVTDLLFSMGHLEHFHPLFFCSPSDKRNPTASQCCEFSRIIH